MKRIIFLLIVTAIVLQLPCIAAMNQSSDQGESVKIICVPGLGGTASDVPDYAPSVVGNTFSYVPVSTPGWPWADLGQEDCINPLRRKLRENVQTQGIIYAMSQGAATAIHYVAAEDQRKQVQGMILEGSLASGNSAIAHTGNTIPILGRLPFLYYWAPYVAKCILPLFPFYSPSGKQSIKSMQNFPKHVPIIFAHSKLDAHVPYDHSCALYYAARKNGNPAYLISKEEEGHVGILDQRDQKMVQTMLKTHKLIPGDPDPTVDLKPYQPDHEQFKDVHDRLVRRERNHTYLGYAVKVGVLAGIAAALRYFALPAAQTLWAKHSGSAAV